MYELDKNLIPIFSSNEIHTRVKELGSEISEKYRHTNPLIIGVLNGSFIFLADLIRSISIDCDLDFIKVKSYKKTKSSGKVQLVMENSLPIKGKDVILVEDIIDTGLTINFIRKKLLKSSPKSFSIASFLSKKGTHNLDFPIDFIGFEIPHKFVVGYGLDFEGKMRNLNGLYYMKND